MEDGAPLAALVPGDLLPLLGGLEELLDDGILIHLVVLDPLEERVLGNVLGHPLEEILHVRHGVNFTTFPEIKI